MKENKFFAVHFNFTIAGEYFRPSVCYPLTSRLAKTVQTLIEQGKATGYEGEVRFVTGRAVSVENTTQPATTPKKARVVVTAQSQNKKNTKNSKKDFQ